MKVIVYAYYSRPWRLQSGDDVRIHTLAKAMKNHLKSTVVVYNLNHLQGKTICLKDDVTYVNTPRRVYQLASRLLWWKQQYDLNPLVKLTHYIDEFIAAVKLADIVRRAKILYVFGSMTLFSLFVRILGSKDIIIIYDPLANYAQTLYLRSRSNSMALVFYGLYIALHKLQLKCSNYVVYPSVIDLKNAKTMFNIRDMAVISNPTPICYDSIDEYRNLRARRRDFDKPYFVLLAGGRGNEEAVKTTIEIFNEFTPGTFRLYITGPWLDLRSLVKNPSIVICGIVSEHKLKELLAVADYGLAPIFNNTAGTFIKVLAYLAAGLCVISSPWGLQGVDLNQSYDNTVFIVNDVEEYKETIHELISKPQVAHQEVLRPILLCRYALDSIYTSLERFMRVIEAKVNENTSS